MIDVTAGLLAFLAGLITVLALEAATMAAILRWGPEPYRTRGRTRLAALYAAARGQAPR